MKLADSFLLGAHAGQLSLYVASLQSIANWNYKIIIQVVNVFQGGHSGDPVGQVQNYKYEKGAIMNRNISNKLSKQPSHNDRWLEDSIDQALGRKPDWTGYRQLPDLKIYLPRGCHIHC